MATGDAQALLLQVSADVSKLQKQFDKAVGIVNSGSDAMERRAKHAGNVIEGAFERPNVGKALTKVFDSSRFAVIEEGSAKLRIFGSALEPLGGLGLAAAAGVAGFALAMEHTEKAVEFAAGVAKLGKVIGVSTDFIQEFNFAAKQSEVDVGAADQALKHLNESLGLVQSGLARKQLANAFKAAGFTPDQLRQFHDVGDFFPVLAERIAGVGNAAEQAAIAKRLGIEELLPLLQAGATNFNTLAKAAQDLGVVMDQATIKKAEEAKTKLNELDQVMKAKANITWAQFADTLITVKTALLEVETAFLRVVQVITNTQPPGDKLAHLVEQRTNFIADSARNHLRADPARLAELDREIAALQKEVAPAKAEGPPPKPPKQLIDTTPHTHKADETLNFDKAAQDAYSAGLKALDQAQLALTSDIQARAVLEKKAVADALAKKTNDKGTGDLDIEEKKIRASKNDAHKKEQLALIAKARTEEQNAAAAQTELIDRQALAATIARDQQFRDQAVQLQEQGLSADEAHFTALAQLADTQAQRTIFERLALDKAQAREAALAQNEVDRAQAELDVANANHDAAAIQRAKNDLARAQAGQASLGRNQADQNAEFSKAHENPIQQFQRSVQDFATTAQTAGVRAMESLADGLADAIVNAHSLGDVAKRVFQQMIADLLAAAIKRDIEAPILAAFGFADGGTVRGPGSSTSDSIPAMLSDGEFVVKASAARKHAALLEAINGGRTPHFADGGWASPGLPTISALKNLSVPHGINVDAGPQVLNFDLRGAVVTADLLKQMNDLANRAGARAYGKAVTDARRGLPGAMRSNQLLGTT